jgi:hypothetical protein
MLVLRGSLVGTALSADNSQVISLSDIFISPLEDMYVDFPDDTDKPKLIQI